MSGIVLLAGPGPVTHIVFNALAAEFPISAVVVEERLSTREMLSRRVARLGLATVIGQILFQAAVVPLLRVQSRTRLAEIAAQHGFDTAPVPDELRIPVPSVNAPVTVDALRGLEPDVVVVQGTRIIAEHVLRAVRCPFVNMHAGITPRYRGVHGAYWALRERRPDLCGVTIHLVDAGVDTGPVLKQAQIRPTRSDNFVTYPMLQLAVGLPLLRDALRELSAGPVEESTRETGPPRGRGRRSRLWSHPTLVDYVWHRLRDGTR